MRLAIVRQDYRPEGAAERCLEGALEALLERNVAISLYTRSWPQTRLQLIEPSIIDPFHLGALWRDYGFARAACRAVRRWQPRLVESHERLLCCDVYRATDGVHAVWLAERLRRAASAGRLAARISPHNRYLLNVERRLFASPWLRAVICGSNMVRDEIRGNFPLPAAKLHVIYDAVDTDIFHPGLRTERARIVERHGIDAAATVYLTVAADCARADLGSAIDALAQLPPPVHLVAIGEQPHAARYRRHAQALGVANRVTLVGNAVDRRPYYGAADAFVLPSLYEPTLGAALEALACAVPVIASAKTGVAELVREHDCGLVFPSGDVAALAGHMRTLQDPTARAGFAANARTVALPLSPAAITLQQVLLYRDLLAAAPADETRAAAKAASVGAHQ
jgi:UDP-glucose:(heptosyl)LPS alpha-1,3-glucosyltransferase